MQIDWWTLALQAVNFLVLVWLLQRFLYRPAKAVIEKRRALAEQAFTEAAEAKAETEAERQRLEAARTELTSERQVMGAQLHAEIESEREAMLADARRQADAVLQEAREDIAAERKAAFAEVREHVAGLASELAGELLRRAGPEVPALAFLEQLSDHLAGLPAAERERLIKDLEPADARLLVRTAEPLASDEQSAWIERLEGILGHGGKTDFDTAADILGGAELHFPHAVVRLTWADQLKKAQAVLQRDDAAS